MKPLISVIVPVYNTELYIERCVQSILNQTYDNLQIILIDDGSVDSSGLICDQFASRYNNVEAFHQCNLGLVETRKRGTHIASGEYIMWVDADDWIEDAYFEKMMEARDKSEADLVVSNIYFDIGESSNMVSNNIEVGKYQVSSIIERMFYIGKFYEYGIQPHGVTKIFKRDKLLKIQNQLPEGLCIGEDAAVVYTYIMSCKTVLITDICGYHYVQNPCSITKRKTKDEIKGIDILVNYLRNTFGENDSLNYQLSIYRKYLIVLRNLTYWDSKGLLYPYGGVQSNDRVIIYGAGGVGQELYRYCKLHNIKVVAWLDRSAEYYVNQGMPVSLSDEYDFEINPWDYIIIANINERSSDKIKRYLQKRGINQSKILWFSDDFLKKEN